MNVEQMMSWINSHMGIFEHATGAILASIAGAVFVAAVHWWRTGRYQRLVRVYITRIVDQKEGLPKFEIRKLFTRTALSLLHRRSLSALLVKAYGNTEDGMFMGPKSWKPKHANAVLAAMADEVYEVVGTPGTVAWAVGDSGVTHSDFMMFAFRKGADIVVVLFGVKDLARFKLNDNMMGVTARSYATQVAHAALSEPECGQIVELCM